MTDRGLLSLWPVGQRRPIGDRIFFVLSFLALGIDWSTPVISPHPPESEFRQVFAFAVVGLPVSSLLIMFMDWARSASRAMAVVGRIGILLIVGLLVLGNACLYAWFMFA